MKLLMLFISVMAVAANSHASGPAASPVIEVSAQETCKEYITAEPRLSANDWPRQALGRDVSAYVVVTYDLDGSGKAQNLRVVDSNPAGLFDKTTVSILKRTDFADGVQAQACTYVRTYGAVRRSQR